MGLSFLNGRGRGRWWAALAAGVAVLASGPAPAADRFQDLQVAVVGQGRPVLMIPGLNSAGSTWTETCAALQPQVQCHVVHLPGFAGAPAVPTERFLEAMRDRLLAYVDDRRLPSPVLMGHSLGGVLALMLAAQAPQRFDRLVIVDSLPFLAALRDPGATAETARAMADGLRRGMAAATPEQYEAQLQASARGMTRSAEGTQRVIEWGRSSDRSTTAQAMAELWGLDLRPALARIARPTLVLGSWAAYEPMGSTLQSTRRIFETQFASLAGVQIEMSLRGYHFLMWDDMDWLVAQVKAFLGR